MDNQNEKKTKLNQLYKKVAVEVALFSFLAVAGYFVAHLCWDSLYQFGFVHSVVSDFGKDSVSKSQESFDSNGKAGPGKNERLVIDNPTSNNDRLAKSKKSESDISHLVQTLNGNELYVFLSQWSPRKKTDWESFLGGLKNRFSKDLSFRVEVLGKHESSIQKEYLSRLGILDATKLYLKKISLEEDQKNQLKLTLLKVIADRKLTQVLKDRAFSVMNSLPFSQDERMQIKKHLVEAKYFPVLSAEEFSRELTW